MKKLNKFFFFFFKYIFLRMNEYNINEWMNKWNKKTNFYK